MKWYSPYFMFTEVILTLLSLYLLISVLTFMVFQSTAPFPLSFTFWRAVFISFIGMTFAPIPSLTIMLWL